MFKKFHKPIKQLIYVKELWFTPIYIIVFKIYDSLSKGDRDLLLTSFTQGE